VPQLTRNSAAASHVVRSRLRNLPEGAGRYYGHEPLPLGRARHLYAALPPPPASPRREPHRATSRCRVHRGGLRYRQPSRAIVTIGGTPTLPGDMPITSAFPVHALKREKNIIVQSISSHSSSSPAPALAAALTPTWADDDC